MFVNVKLDSTRGLHYKIAGVIEPAISNGTIKTQFEIPVFLYFGVFVKNSFKIVPFYLDLS